MRRSIWRIGVGAVSLVLLSGLLLGAGYLWLCRSGRPHREGQVRLPGLEQPVTVYWDAFGVPSVEAGTEHDLALAFGYLHANDRFFQMDLMRRMARGELAEWFGEGALDSDLHFRRFETVATARAEWSASPASTQAWLTAYAEGVNAYLEERGSDRFPEYRLLRLPPCRPWEPLDSLVLTRLLALFITPSELPAVTHLRWLGSLGPERTAELLGRPGVPVDPDLLALATPALPSPPAPVVPPIIENVANLWTVPGSQSVSSARLFAGSLFGGLFAPNTFYQVLLRSPGLEVAGMTVPGLPVVLMGQNGKLAWGIDGAEVQQWAVFLERVGKGGREVLRGETWTPLIERTETFAVRDQPPVERTLSRSDLGVFLEADPSRGLPAMSIATPLLEPGDSLTPFLRLMHARRADDPLPEWERFGAPVRQLLVVDALRASPRVIGKGTPAEEPRLLPEPAWSAAPRWSGWRHRPAAELASEETVFWVRGEEQLRFGASSPWRLEAIEKALSPTPGAPLSLDTLAQAQLGLRSEHARAVVAALAPHGPFGKQAQAALEQLQHWSGDFELHGPSALYALVEAALLEAAFSDDAGAAGIDEFATSSHLLALLQGRMRADWWDDVRTERPEDPRERIGGALQRAWEEARRRWGADPRGWSYGELHLWRADHPLGGVPLLGLLFPPFELQVPGGEHAPLQYEGPRWPRTGGFPSNVVVDHGPAARWLADLSDPERSRAQLFFGQAGHFADPHFGDQLELNRTGKLRPVAWSARAARSQARTTLQLLPASR